MDDSFLEELDIINPEGKSNLGQKPSEQYITKRNSRSTGAPSKRSDLEDLMECQENIDVNTNPVDSEALRRSEFMKDQKRQITKHQELRKQTEQEMKLQHVQSRVLDRKMKLSESKGKFIDTARSKVDDLRPKQHELRNKAIDTKQASKENNRRSGSSTPSIRTSDPFSKENNVLPDLSKQIDNATPSRSSAGSKKIEVKDPLALLNAMKELVSTYSKQESTKILRAMQELHINSQASMIKHLLIQTEDLTREIHPSKDTSRLRKLVEENERMREDLIILRLRNEELRRKVDESILIKEENVELKLRLKELSKSGS